MTPWYPQQLRRHPGYAGLKGFISSFSYLEIIRQGNDLVHIRTLIPWNILRPNDNFHALESIQAAVTQRLAAAHSPALACCKELDYCPSRTKRIWLPAICLPMWPFAPIQSKSCFSQNVGTHFWGFFFGCNQFWGFIFPQTVGAEQLLPCSDRTAHPSGQSIVRKRAGAFFSIVVSWYLPLWSSIIIWIWIETLYPWVNTKIAGKWIFIPRINGKIYRYWSKAIYWPQECKVSISVFYTFLSVFGAAFSYLWPVPIGLGDIKVKESGPQGPNGGRISSQCSWASLILTIMVSGLRIFNSWILNLYIYICSISSNPLFWPTWPTWPIPVADQKKVRHPKIPPCTADQWWSLVPLDATGRFGLSPIMPSETGCRGWHQVIQVPRVGEEKRDVMWRLTRAEIKGSMGWCKIGCLVGVTLPFTSL